MQKHLWIISLFLNWNELTYSEVFTLFTRHQHSDPGGSTWRRAPSVGRGWAKIYKKCLTVYSKVLTCDMPVTWVQIKAGSISGIRGSSDMHHNMKLAVLFFHGIVFKWTHSPRASMQLTHWVSQEYVHEEMETRQNCRSKIKQLWHR